VKWIGKLGENVKASIRLNGNLLSKSTKKCRCGELVDLSRIIDEENGLKLTRALQNIEGKLGWGKRWNILSHKVVEGKISLDSFFEEQVKLTKHYRKEWDLPSEVSISTDAVCPKCHSSIGQVTTILRRVNEPEIMDFTKQQLTNLEPSKSMLAYASKRMNFGSVEQLEAWLADADAGKAITILEKTIDEINELALSYDASLITADLRRQISHIQEETRRRKVEFVNAVERIVQERTPIIK
jgi:hypothetical protein